MHMVLSSFIAVSALLLSCTSSNNTGGSQPLPRSGAASIETLAHEHGHYSPELESRMTVVVNARAELAELWRRAHAGIDPMPAMPEVDFTRESVVLATSGMKSSGGYTVTVEALEEVPEGMRLVVVERGPGPNCMTTQALTTPLHIVRTPKLPAVVLFDVREEIEDCE